MEPARGEGGVPFGLYEADLEAPGMNFIMDARVIADVAAGVIGDLPCVVTHDADVDEPCHGFLQRKELAEAPVQREVIAGSDIHAADVTVDLIGGGQRQRRVLVIEGIPDAGELHLVRPESQAGVVRSAIALGSSRHVNAVAK